MLYEVRLMPQTFVDGCRGFFWPYADALFIPLLVQVLGLSNSQAARANSGAYARRVHLVSFCSTPPAPHPTFVST